jgi:hypothetical protein
VNYSCQVTSGAATVSSSIERSTYQPWWKSAKLTIYGALTPPKEVHIREQTIQDWRYDSLAHAVTLTVPDALKNWSVRLAF